MYLKNLYVYGITMPYEIFLANYKLQKGMEHQVNNAIWM